MNYHEKYPFTSLGMTGAASRVSLILVLVFFWGIFLSEPAHAFTTSAYHSQVSSSRCLQPPQTINLMTLSDSQLQLYGLPSQFVLHQNPKEWSVVLAHAKHRTCGSYPEPDEKITHSLVKSNPDYGVSSQNWSGNITDGNRGTYRSAQVDFYVPAIPTLPGNATAGFWAGVGGDKNMTYPAEVVQAGVETDVSSVYGQQNQSWWAVAPNYDHGYAQNLPLSRVDIGDHIHVYVDSNINNDGYDYFYMANMTANSYNSKTLYGSQYFSDSESGECIAERPTINGGYNPLAQWQNSGQPTNTMKFYSCSIYAQNQGSDGIGNWPHYYVYIINGNNQTMASPGPIVNYGFDYTEIWYRGT